MGKKKKRASLNFSNKIVNDNIKITDEMKIKQQLKRAILGKNEELTWVDIDAVICRPEGYSEKIYKYGSVGRGWDLFEEVERFAGRREVRQVFRNWLKAMNLTISSVSKTLYPEKSQSYLSTMLNEDNRDTYSDELINEAFLKAKEWVDKGYIKINGETIQDKVLRILNETTEETEIEVVKPKITSKPIKKERDEDMNFVVITNFKTKKQEIVNIGEDGFKKYNDFFESIKKVMEITQDVTVTPFSTDVKKND